MAHKGLWYKENFLSSWLRVDGKGKTKREMGVDNEVRDDVFKKGKKSGRKKKKKRSKFLAGAFRIALRTALEDPVLGGDTGDEVRQIRGWKLLLLLPRLLLSKPPRGGTIGKDKLVKRFQMFANGQWQDLFRFGVQCAEELGNARRRHRRRATDSEAKRSERAFMLAQLGELSSARQALEGAELAAVNLETLEETCTIPRSVARQHRTPRPSFGIRAGRGKIRAQSEDSPQRSCSWPFRHDQRTPQTSVGEPPSTALVLPTGRTTGHSQSAESFDRSCADGAYDSFEETGWRDPRHCGW